MKRVTRLAAMGVGAALVVRLLDIALGPALPGLLSLMLVGAVASLVLGRRGE